MFIWNRWRHLKMRLWCLEQRVADLESKAQNPLWIRVPELDKRIANGDDFAGDAWLSTIDRTVKYTAVNAMLSGGTVTLDKEEFRR